jgi:hypothetical protein
MRDIPDGRDTSSHWIITIQKHGGKGQEPAGHQTLAVSTGDSHFTARM